jgi:hypothetical protein
VARDTSTRRNRACMKKTSTMPKSSQKALASAADRYTGASSSTPWLPSSAAMRAVSARIVSSSADTPMVGAPELCLWWESAPAPLERFFGRRSSGRRCRDTDGRCTAPHSEARGARRANRT